MTQVVREPDELRRIAIRAAGELDGAPADAVLDWAAAEFGERFAVATSMQDAVLTHLASRSLPGVDVLFLDTGYHFEETLQTRDAVASTYDVALRTLEPSQSVAEQDATYGANLFERDPDLCCALRKTHPLDEALDGYEAWATGAVSYTHLTLPTIYSV